MGKLLDEARKLEAKIEPSGFHPMGADAAIQLRSFLVRLAEQVESQRYVITNDRDDPHRTYEIDPSYPIQKTSSRWCAERSLLQNLSLPT